MSVDVESRCSHIKELPFSAPICIVATTFQTHFSDIPNVVLCQLKPCVVGSVAFGTVTDVSL